jgi:serine/threonine protein kinase
MAEETGQEVLPASGAHDIWALGLIAYEMLTGRPGFETPKESCGSLSDGVDMRIRQQLIGELPLPWEDPLTRGTMHKLHSMKRSVMLCLSRNPQERPQSEWLLDLWNEVFENVTGTTADRFPWLAQHHHTQGQPA